MSFEKILAEWSESDGDGWWRHFDEFQRDNPNADWCEISTEAKEIWDLMFGEETEIDSPLDILLSASTAAAYTQAYYRLGRLLGFEEEPFRHAVESLLERPDERVTLEELAAEVVRAKKFQDDLSAGKYDDDSLDALPEAQKIETNG